MTPFLVQAINRSTGVVRTILVLGLGLGRSADCRDKQGHIIHAVTRRRWNEAQLLRLAATLLR
jgi:hypothetical protein